MNQNQKISKAIMELDFMIAEEEQKISYQLENYPQLSWVREKHKSIEEMRKSVDRLIADFFNHLKD